MRKVLKGDGDGDNKRTVLGNHCQRPAARTLYGSDSHMREERKQVAWSSTRVLAYQTGRVCACGVKVP